VDLGVEGSLSSAGLTFGGNILETGTDSYRLAQTRAQQAAAS
jgi:hypothetical protein